MTQQKTQREPKTENQETPAYLWRSGDLVEWEKATVHISMLAWTAISAVFEGVRAYWNPDNEQLFVFRLDAHIKRLFQSMKIMRMTSPFTKDELTQAVLSLLRANSCRCDSYPHDLPAVDDGNVTDVLVTHDGA